MKLNKFTLIGLGLALLGTIFSEVGHNKEMEEEVEARVAEHLDNLETNEE